MSQYSSAFLAYGMRLPAGTSTAHVQAAIHGNVNGVGYVEAGPYDQDSLFLTTYFESASPGSPKTIDAPEPHADWDRALRHAAELIGFDFSDLEEPAWLLIADIS
jgi:hypothetical protein